MKWSPPGALGPQPRAFSQVEVMVAIAILGIAFIGAVSSFRGISKSLTQSSVQTLAVSLAQEKMDQLKSRPYAKLPVSGSSWYSAFAHEKISYFRLSPDESWGRAYYDAINYDGIEEIVRAGQKFKRLVRVVYGVADGWNPVVNQIDAMRFYGPGEEADDSGLKIIFVQVLWEEKPNYYRNYLLNALKTNEMPEKTNLRLNIQVTDTGGLPRRIYLYQRNALYSNFTVSDATGKAVLYVNSGTHTIVASENSIVTSTFSAYVGNESLNGETQVNVVVTPLLNGPVRVTPWMFRGLLISRVVASTQPAEVGVDQEFVELYNPTTYTWLVQGRIGLFCRRPDAMGLGFEEYNLLDPTNVAAWTHTSIPARGYFLIGNQATINLPSLGGPVPVDAQWTGAFSSAWGDDLIPSTASLRIEFMNGEKASPQTCLYTRGTDSNPTTTPLIDSLGWGVPPGGWGPPYAEGRPADPFLKYGVSQSELSVGSQFFRLASSTSYSSSAANRYWGGHHWGPGYDTDDNLRDFCWEPSLTSQPNNAATPPATPLWGWCPLQGLANNRAGWYANFLIVADRGLPRYNYAYNANTLTQTLQAGEGWDITFLQAQNPNAGHFPLSIYAGTTTIYSFYVPFRYLPEGNPYSLVMRRNVTVTFTTNPSNTVLQPWINDQETRAIFVGHVREWSNLQLMGVPVSIQDNTTAVRTVAHTLEQGFFEIPLTPSLNLQTARINEWTESGSLAEYDNGQVGSRLDEGQGLKDFSAKLPMWGYIDGFLYKAGQMQGWITTTGSPGPAGGMNAMIVSFSELNGQLMRQVTTDSGGQFKINLPVGKYRVQPQCSPGEKVSPPFFQWEVKPDYLLYDAYSGAVIPSDARVFKLLNGYGYLEGVVKTTDNKTIADGALLVLSTYTFSGLPPALTPGFRSAHPAFYTATTSPDGYYKLRALSGDYYLTAWRIASDGVSSSVQSRGPGVVTIQPGQKLNQNVLW